VRIDSGERIVTEHPADTSYTPAATRDYGCQALSGSSFPRKDAHNRPSSFDVISFKEFKEASHNSTDLSIGSGMSKYPVAIEGAPGQLSVKRYEKRSLWCGDDAQLHVIAIPCGTTFSRCEDEGALSCKIAVTLHGMFILHLLKIRLLIYVTEH